MPDTLQAFAQDALTRLLADKESLACALGEVMTEPKPKVWFDEPDADWVPGAIALDRRTRMMHDARHVFINGEGFRAAGRDAGLMRKLADARQLGASERQRLSAPARALLAQWLQAGWAHESD